jgi:hypothetical protein
MDASKDRGCMRIDEGRTTNGRSEILKLRRMTKPKLPQNPDLISKNAFIEFAPNK